MDRGAPTVDGFCPAKELVVSLLARAAVTDLRLVHFAARSSIVAVPRVRVGQIGDRVRAGLGDRYRMAFVRFTQRAVAAIGGPSGTAVTHIIIAGMPVGIPVV